jgi:hypothetical protein
MVDQDSGSESFDFINSREFEVNLERNSNDENSDPVESETDDAM